MPDEFDHEVIDSPQALFRHLYEAHGVVEALDLDPATAPLQFWLRRHTELERAASRATAHDRSAAEPVARAERFGATERLPAAEPVAGAQRPAAPRRPAGGGPAGGGPAGEPGAGGVAWAEAGAAASQPTGRGGGRAAGARPGGPAGVPGAGSGPRFRPFGDPLVEALATALVGSGLDERWVRRGLSTFTVTDGRHGEEAVRAAFIVPMLEAVAAHLAGDPPNGTRWPPPPPTAPREAARTGPPPREPTPREPAATRAGSPAAEQEARVAQPLAARASGPEPDADFMAIADVLQERRRSRRGGRRDGGRRDGSTLPVTNPPPARAPAREPAREPDDDVMALADALQRRRRARAAPH